MKLLISGGAAIDHVNRNGETALMLAAGAGQFAAVQVLLDAGADAMVRNHEGKTASRMATDFGHGVLAIAMDGIVARAGSTSTTSSTTSSTTASSLTSSTNASSSTSGTTAAMPIPVFSTGPATWQEAVERNDIEGLKKLMIEAERLERQLLHPLQKRGKKSTVIRMPTPPSPLHFAASKGYTAAVKALLTAGADPSAAAWLSLMTALMKAASAGHTATVQALLLAGAEVDKTDRSGQTALIHAAANGSTAIVRALLQAGANVKRKDAKGKTALSSARAGNHVEIINLLRAHGATS